MAAVVVEVAGLGDAPLALDDPVDRWVSPVDRSTGGEVALAGVFPPAEGAAQAGVRANQALRESRRDVLRKALAVGGLVGAADHSDLLVVLPGDEVFAFWVAAVQAVGRAGPLQVDEVAGSEMPGAAVLQQTGVDSSVLSRVRSTIR
ncbi:hypothetical protein BH11ACT1_BH11ACT1_01530 [soil metagenome]